MKKFQSLLAAIILTLPIASHAWDFQTLPTDFPDNPLNPLLAVQFCETAEDLDSSKITGCKITNGQITGTDGSGNLYALPDSTDPVFPDFRDAPDNQPVGPNPAPYITLTLFYSNT